VTADQSASRGPANVQPQTGEKLITGLTIVSSTSSTTFIPVPYWAQFVSDGAGTWYMTGR